MKDYFKYGIATAIIWNILIVLMAIIAASIRQVEYSYFFDDGIGGIGICLFLIAWSLIWFYIGYHSRKKYIQKKLFYKEMAPSIDDKRFNQEYAAYYFSKQAKLLSILLVGGTALSLQIGTRQSEDLDFMRWRVSKTEKMEVAWYQMSTISP